MARIKKIVKSNPVSNFRQVAADGGGSLRVLAHAMNTAYERLEPAAMEKMKREGTEHGLEAARKQIGDDRPFQPSDDIDAFNASLAQTESGGSFVARNSEGFSGKYQFGQPRLDDFNRANGSKFTTDDLIANTPEARALTERVQRWHVNDIDADLGGLVGQVVGGQQMTKNAIRAMAHLGGKGGARRFIESGGKYDPADSNGTRLSDYARTHGSVGNSAPEEQGTVIRTSEGKIQLRKYSPYAGPILQAHNAAAAVAYQSEMLNKGQMDLLELSAQFPLDPDGYAQAAQSYVDSIIEQAPTEVAGDLRNVLNRETQRRQMGLMVEKQSDIRNRANNSSLALVNRWSDELAEAVASGDPYEVDEAQRRLDNVLQAREALPGVAWTEEQSANVFIKADQRANKIVADQRKARSDEFSDTFDLITSAAKDGATAEGEEILRNPDAVALHPEKAREAQAFANLRDNLPEFLKMTPDEQSAAVARLAGVPVSEEWELDIVKAAEKSAKENRAAWDKDPVKQAAHVMDNPPPSLPDLTTEDPDAFVSALSARREYMNRIRDEGYSNTHAYLSEEEAEGIAAMMGQDVPVEAVLAISGAIVAGFGSDAVRVFDEIDGDDVMMFAGKVVASGGPPKVAVAMLNGQRMLNEGLVQVPPKSDRIAAVDPSTAEAFHGIPGAIGAQGEVMKAAQAIYASEARGIEPNSDAAASLMKQSIQVALGQSKNKRGEVVGGVQPVLGHSTLLPVNVNGVEVERAMRKAFGAGVAREGVVDSLTGMVTDLGVSILGGETGPQPDAWAAGGVSQRPVNTKQQTPDGRPIWFQDGEFFSEKTITSGTADGKFYNVPTVGPDGMVLSDEKAVALANATGTAIDPITKKPLTMFDSLEEAIEAAETRSNDMPNLNAADYRKVPRFNGKPIPAGMVETGMVRIVSAGGNMYRMEISSGNAKFDVEDESGNVFVFDMAKFLEASQ